MNHGEIIKLESEELVLIRCRLNTTGPAIEIEGIYAGIYEMYYYYFLGPKGENAKWRYNNPNDCRIFKTATDMRGCRSITEYSSAYLNNSNCKLLQHSLYLCESYEIFKKL